MNRNRLLFVLFSVACLVPIVSGSLSRAATEGEAGEDSLSKQLAVFSEVLSLIRRAYVEEAPVEQLLEGALDGSTHALDPLSTFVPAEEVEEYRRTRQAGSRRSGLTIAKERGIAYVVAVEAGSPGELAGFQQRDVLASIAGQSTRTMPLWKLQTYLADEPGSRLQIEVLRRGQSHELALTLEEFEASLPRLEERRDVAVLRLNRFDQRAVPGVRQALEGLRDAAQDKLIVDLRGVAGGDAAAAYQMGGFFVQGRLGELKGSREAPVDFESTAEPIWQGETVVLIDRGCLGPSEVFASILRQKAGARLVGQSSFGHAGRLAALTLSNGSQLFLTDAFFTGPDGEPIDDKLTPDLVVDDSYRRFSELAAPTADLILERGLELLLSGEELPMKKVA